MFAHASQVPFVYFSAATKPNFGTISKTQKQIGPKPLSYFTDRNQIQNRRRRIDQIQNQINSCGSGFVAALYLFEIQAAAIGPGNSIKSLHACFQVFCYRLNLPTLRYCFWRK